MATHSSVLAWRIPGMGELGGLPFMGSHRVGHDGSDLAAAAAGLSISLFSSSFYSRESRILRYLSAIKKVGKVGTRIQSQASRLQHLSSPSLILVCPLLKLGTLTYIYLLGFTTQCCCGRSLSELRC